MARIATIPFEFNSLAAGVGSDAITGSPVSSTAVVRSGTYSMLVDTSGAAAITFARYNLFTSDSLTTLYARMYVYLTQYPNGTTGLIKILNTSNASMCQFAMQSNGTCRILNAGGTRIGGVDSGVLSLNQWHCLEISIDATGSNGTVTGRIDGGQFASGAGTATTGVGRIQFGFIASVTGICYFDDGAINDSTGGSQNSWPGPGNVVRVKPNAQGDSNGFLVNLGGTVGVANNFTRVNEVTPDGATTYNATAIVASDLFGVEASGIPAGASITCVLVGGQLGNLVSADATAAARFQIEKTSGGTISTSADIIPNGTAMTINKGQAGVASYPLTTYADPDGAAWTVTTVGTMQIGYKMQTANVRSIAVSGAWALVEYVPAASNNPGGVGMF